MGIGFRVSVSHEKDGDDLKKALFRKKTSCENNGRLEKKNLTSVQQNDTVTSSVASMVCASKLSFRGKF
jgi:hypothetical protein